MGGGAVAIASRGGGSGCSQWGGAVAIASRGGGSGYSQ